ncbi:hypothetical protein HEP87_52820 [Streptomyces sp. S1D4-11]
MHDEQTSLPKQLPEQLRAFLAEEGFGSLAAGLSFAHARQYSTVWTAELLHPTGPAVLQLFTRGRLRGIAGQLVWRWATPRGRRSPACAVRTHLPRRAHFPDCGAVRDVRDDPGMLVMSDGVHVLARRPTKPKMSMATANLQRGDALIVQRVRQPSRSTTATPSARSAFTRAADRGVAKSSFLSASW